MKNIFKYIFVAMAVAVLPQTNIWADDDNLGAIKLFKETSAPDENGICTITLTQFVTATNIIEYSSTPVDLILALDSSGSMSSNYIKSYAARTSQSYSYNGYGSNTYYYQMPDGVYYPVKSEHTNGNPYYLTLIYRDSQKYYLSGSGAPSTTPSGATSNTGTIWEGVLYRQNNTRTTRFAALKSAVKTFIETVDARAKGTNGTYEGAGATTTDDVDHKIAVIQWGGNATTLVPLQSVENNATSMISKVNAMDKTSSGTNQYAGIEAAADIINAIPATRVSNKVVVLFTDGDPNVSRTSNDQVANNTIAAAKALKEAGVKVFTIGLFDGQSTYANIHKMMQYTSSEYPHASNLSTPGTPNDDGKLYYQQANGSDLTSIFNSIAESEAGDTYNLTASHASIDVLSPDFSLPVGFNPTSVEWEIWSCKGRDDNSPDEYAWTKFAHGKNASATGTDISYTADTQGAKEYKGDRPFVELIDPDTSKGETEKRIKVNGFWYSKDDDTDTDASVIEYGNWVGPRKPNEKDEANKDYAGKKLVIKFNVQVKPNSFGGYNMPSNTISSAIYDVDGNEVKKYAQPLVDYPSICIRKRGLNTEDTAIFDVNIYQTGDDTKASVYKYTVLLTEKGDDQTYAVIKGLNVPSNGLTVEVKERTNWTWTYTPSGATALTKNLVAPEMPEGYIGTWDNYKAKIRSEQNGTSYTGDYYVLNDAFCLYFNFVNEPKTVTQLHGEDVVHNMFGTGGGSAEHGGVEPEEPLDPEESATN